MTASLGRYARPTAEEVKAFNRRLKTARIAAGFSQRELAFKVGVEERTISTWESNRSPNTTNMERLAEVLKVNFDWLCYGKTRAICDGSVMPDEELASIVREIEIARQALDRVMQKLTAFNTRQLTD
jgi:transcriptional regulator with XRE-family HTH domain